MKSVLITFDQAYYERIMALLDRLTAGALHTLKRCRDVAQRQAIRTSVVMPGPVCVRLSLRWSMTIKSIRCWIHCIRWTCRPNSWDYVHLYGTLNGPSSVRTVNK